MRHAELRLLETIQNAKTDVVGFVGEDWKRNGKGTQRGRQTTAGGGMYLVGGGNIRPKAERTIS